MNFSDWDQNFYILIDVATGENYAVPIENHTIRIPRGRWRPYPGQQIDFKTVFLGNASDGCFLEGTEEIDFNLVKWTPEINQRKLNKRKPLGSQCEFAWVIEQHV